jgi:hypothetical protein
VAAARQNMSNFADLTIVQKAARALGFTIPRSLIDCAIQDLPPSKHNFIDDPGLSTSRDILQSICDKSDNYSNHLLPAARFLGKLMRPGATERRKVDIKEITAVAHSKGRFVSDFKRLIPTISPPTRALTHHQQIDCLQRQVMSEGVTKNEGRVRFVCQDWNRRLTVCNTGTARRFALLRDLVEPGQVTFDAEIEHWQIDEDIKKRLSEYHVAMVPKPFWDKAGLALETWYPLRFFKINDVQSLACGDPTDRTEWAVVTTERRSKLGVRLLESLRIKGCRPFDLSHWIEHLSDLDY